MKTCVQALNTDQHFSIQNVKRDAVDIWLFHIKPFKEPIRAGQMPSRLGASISRAVGLSLCLSVCLQPQNKCGKVNATSTEARLAPGSCTVEYKQLTVCTCVQCCLALPKGRSDFVQLWWPFRKIYWKRKNALVYQSFLLTLWCQNLMLIISSFPKYTYKSV